MPQQLSKEDYRKAVMEEISRGRQTKKAEPNGLKGLQGFQGFQEPKPQEQLSLGEAPVEVPPQGLQELQEKSSEEPSSRTLLEFIQDFHSKVKEGLIKSASPDKWKKDEEAMDPQVKSKIQSISEINMEAMAKALEEHFPELKTEPVPEEDTSNIKPGPFQKEGMLPYDKFRDLKKREQKMLPKDPPMSIQPQSGIGPDPSTEIPLPSEEEEIDPRLMV